MRAGVRYPTCGRNGRGSLPLGRFALAQLRGTYASTGVGMDSSAVMDKLAGVDLFHGLSRRELKRLAALAREVTHQDGDAAVAEGHTGVGFHLVLDGSATVTSNGVQRRVLGPGDHFGEISLLDGLPRSASVVADGTLRTLYIPRDEFSTLLDQHPEISRSLLTVLCARLRSVESANATG